MTDLSHRDSGSPFDDLSDDELLAAVRAGDTGAYSALYHRHLGAALNQARRMGGADDPQDVAQEAFLKILKTIIRGGGPQNGFVGYLMRAVRNEAIDRSRRAREFAVEDVESVGTAGPSVSDSTDERFDQDLVKRAFNTLPEKWQQILWLTEVEGQAPRAVAPQLGQSPNAVAQLSRRAREGLRTAWLQAHVDVSSAREECRQVAGALGAYERGQLSSTRAARVEAHLEGCVRCAVALTQLREVSARMRALLLPLVLGSPLLLASLSEVLALPGPTLMLDSAPDAAGPGGSEGGGGASEAAEGTAAPTDPSAGAQLVANAAASDVAAKGTGSAFHLAWWKAPTVLHGWAAVVAAPTAAVAVAGIVLTAQLPAEVADPGRTSPSHAAGQHHQGAANLGAPSSPAAPTQLPESAEEDPAAEEGSLSAAVGAKPVSPVVVGVETGAESPEPSSVEIWIDEPQPDSKPVPLISPPATEEARSPAPPSVPSEEPPQPTEPAEPTLPEPEPEPEPLAEPTLPPVEPAPTAEPEPTVELKEPPVEPQEPTTEPTEPPVEPTEPTTEPEPTEPAEPTAPPVEPEPTEPTEPPVEPTEPPVEPEPTEPPVEPTEPPVEPEPTEPPVEPTEPPVEPEPTEPAEPAVSAPTIEYPVGGYVTFPVTLSGEGTPGALVRIHDSEGQEVASTTVGEDGRWSVAPSPGAPDVATRYRAVQETDGSTSEPSEASDEYVFLAPALRSPAPESTVPVNISIGGWDAALFALEIDAPAQQAYSLFLNGQRWDFAAPADGATASHLALLMPGTYTVELAYHDPRTGQLGTLRSTTLTVD